MAIYFVRRMATNEIEGSYVTKGHVLDVLYPYILKLDFLRLGVTNPYVRGLDLSR